MTAAELELLAQEIAADPEGLGYAAFAAVGSDGNVAEMLNTGSVKTPSRAVVLFGADCIVSAGNVSDALQGARIDAAVAAYMAGSWPAVAVSIPEARIAAEGITPAHFLAAKIAQEGGVPTKLVRLGKGEATDALANAAAPIDLATIALEDIPTHKEVIDGSEADIAAAMAILGKRADALDMTAAGKVGRIYSAEGIFALKGKP